ncbi:MAG: GSCFA domain-containing protein [Bacteroidaceae bacterium]|nr:GSCFA domain-containing protein [Bacteroidaceae bacterium]
MVEEANPDSVRHTRVEIPLLLRGIGRQDSLVMLGSCFAQYMGERMSCEGFEVTVNPLGTLFNPFSIGQTVRAALDARGVELPIFPTEGEWRCWWANTRFKAPTPQELEILLRERYEALGNALCKAQHLIITLGTNVCYRTPWPSSENKDSDIVVTNCQRQPDRLFREWRASVAEITADMACTVDLLLQANPSLQIILTVSPYRYHKYGYHGSQLSKATLLLAEDELIRQFPQSCCYFPAYEILLDELRDYQFYAPDGHHPGQNAVDVIWQRFQKGAGIRLG